MVDKCYEDAEFLIEHDDVYLVDNDDAPELCERHVGPVLTQTMARGATLEGVMISRRGPV
jgi:hypothetical protein